MLQEIFIIMNLHEYDRKTMNITAHYHYGNKDFSVSQIIIKSYYLGITIWSDWLNQFLWKVDIYSETWLYYLYFGMVLGKEQNGFHIIYIKKSHKPVLEQCFFTFCFQPITTPTKATRSLPSPKATMIPP